MVAVPETIAPPAGRRSVDRPTTRLRVAVVQHGGMFGGAERWQHQLASATDRMDALLVAIGGGDTSERWRGRGARVASVPSRNKWGIPALAVDVAAVLRADRPDVVVAHGVKAALAAVPAARALGIPAAWVRHDPSFTGPLTDFLDVLADGQMATNDWLFEKTSASHTIVLQPPRMPRGHDRDEARSRLGLEVAEGGLVVGMGSRFNPNKGIDDAIRALAHPRAGSWVLAVAGIEDPAHPEEPRRLQALAESLGVDDRVVYLGNVPELSDVISAFDAVAVLTKPVGRMAPEAFGMVALEAMTSGVPVIAVPPVSDRLAGGGVGVAADSPDEVGEALALLSDPETRRRCGILASRAAQEHPDAATVAAAMATFLADLAGRPGAGLSPHRPMSVVTTVLDEAGPTDVLLTALRAQLAADDEVIVVDGGSTDPTVEVVRQHAVEDARIRLIVAAGAGISRGRNVGVAAATNDLIACTDAGCLPAPDWLGALRRAVSARSDADLWTGTYRVTARTAWERALAVTAYPQVDELPARTPWVALYGRLFGRRFDASMPTGRSVAFTRAAWRRAGGFPEDLATGEDVTFGRRIVQTGGTAVLTRDAEVAWTQRPTLAGNLRMFMKYGEGSGYSLHPRLLGRDFARAIAYPVGAGILAGGGPRLRAAASVAAGAYLSVPLARALRGPQPARTAALVPAMAAARDISKAAGALSALARRPRRRLRLEETVTMLGVERSDYTRLPAVGPMAGPP